MRRNGIAPRRRPVPGLGSLRSLRPGTGPGSHPVTHSTQGNLKHSKGDISKLEKRGHLYFALTHWIKRVINNVGQGRLTVKKVRAINQPGLYGDGNTLYLRVAPGGSKQWIQRLTIHGRRHDIGLGGCSWVTLAQAREAAYTNRSLARRGGDPLAVKRQPKVPTFREAA